MIWAFFGSSMYAYCTARRVLARSPVKGSKMCPTFQLGSFRVESQFQQHVLLRLREQVHPDRHQL
jgi:hypothetical protein